MGIASLVDFLNRDPINDRISTDDIALHDRTKDFYDITNIDSFFGLGIHPDRNLPATICNHILGAVQELKPDFLDQSFNSNRLTHHIGVY